MKITLLIILLFILSNPLFGQSQTESISLEEVHNLLYTESPAADKSNLQVKINDFNRRIAESGWFPELELEAGASYQSDVTDFPFDSPTINIPEFSKDRYNLSLNIVQPIYDGGRTRSAIEKQKRAGELLLAGFDTELFNLKQQADRVYFTILVLQQRKERMRLILDDLNEQLSMVRSSVEHGVLLPGDEAQIRAEIITRQQEVKQLDSDIINGIETLETILERDISRETKFQLPDRSGWKPPEEQEAFDRPDIEQLQLRSQLLETEKEAALRNRLPVVSVYANPFYGRPGFNIFNDDLTFNWIVGIKATWSFKSRRNAGIQAESIEIESKKNRRDLKFLQNDQKVLLDRLKAEINILEEQIKMDREIIRLRRTVTEEKEKQLAVGSITSADYIRALNARERSEIQLEIRKLMRIQKIIQYETEWGWKWN